MRHVIAVTSDHHCGSTIGLCPPSVRLDDGGTYHSSEPQKWMWEKWTRYWRQVAQEVAAKPGTKLVQVFNGDITDGDHHKTTQILSGNPVAQAQAVNASLAIPLAMKPKAMLFVRGTEAHVGPSAAFEERIADGLRRDKRPVLGEEVTGNASHWNAKLDIQGVRFDFAHHGKMGTTAFTKGNITIRHAAEIFYEHAKRGEPHPHVAVRSHYHQFYDTGSAHPTRLIQTPAWQLATAFIHRIAPGAIADVGGIIFVVEDGQLEVKPVVWHPDPMKRMVL